MISPKDNMTNHNLSNDEPKGKGNNYKKKQHNIYLPTLALCLAIQAASSMTSEFA